MKFRKLMSSGTSSILACHWSVSGIVGSRHPNSQPLRSWIPMNQARSASRTARILSIHHDSVQKLRVLSSQDRPTLCRPDHNASRQQEIVEDLSAGRVSAKNMGTITKELGRLEVVLEAQAAVTAREAEARDLDEVSDKEA